MLFNSQAFIFLFLPFTLFLFYFFIKINKKSFIIPMLGIMSLVFYACWNPKFLILLLGSIFFNYFIGLVLAKANSAENKKLAKFAIIFGVATNLLVLGYFKYYNFFIYNTNALFHLSLKDGNIILPLGISFFTFTQIAFLVDTYKKEASDYNFSSYLLFVTFFPHLIAGPILHHKEMMPQFYDKENLNVKWNNINTGIVLFVIGLAKKVLLADKLALFATPIFNAVAVGHATNLLFSWMGALAYTFQLYFDFSGYSDMAVGLGLLFNIKLPINFFSPYRSTSIIEFWRRWHITLSRYLRDYLYFPLGGNRKGYFKQLRNVMLTMLIAGLWHGAGWTYVLWGGMHGLYSIINHSWRKLNIKLNAIFAWMLTFLSVVLAWVVFRADSIKSALIVIKGLFGFNHVQNLECISTHQYDDAFIYIGIAFFMSIFLPNAIEFSSKVSNVLNIDLFEYKPKLLKYIYWRPNTFCAILLGVLATICILSLVTHSEFLYFQF